MIHASFRRIVVALALLAFGGQSLVLAPRAQAATIGTQAVLAADSRGTDLERVEAALASAEVHDRLVALGVEPAHARARIAALTDAELARLASAIDSAPAGGDLLAVVGLVFVVLLILELVGVTDIFKKI